MRRIPRAVLLVALALGLVAPGGEARSAENGDFSLRPVRPASASERDRSYVVKTVAAGTTFSDTLEARNLTDAPLDLVVEPVDATVTADGAFAAAASRSAVGAWITTTPSQVRVPARGSRRVTIEVAVPADAVNGDHIAAVVLRRADAGQGQGTVRVVEQVGVRVYLTVTGGRAAGESSKVGLERAFELRALRWVGTTQKRAFEVDVANVGSLLVEPLGTLTIGQGDLVTELDLPVLGTVLPGKTTTLRIQSDGALAPGTYEGRVRLHDVHGGPEQEASTTFTVEAGAADDKAPVKKKSRLPLWPALLATAGLVAVTVQLVRRKLAAAS